MKNAAMKPAALLVLAALLGTIAACGASPDPSEGFPTVQARMLSHTVEECAAFQARITSLDDLTDEAIYGYPGCFYAQNLAFRPADNASDFTVERLDGVLYFLGLSAESDTELTIRYGAQLDGVKLVYVHPDGTVEHLDSAAPDTELTLTVPAGESAFAAAGYQGRASIQIQPGAQDGITLDTGLTAALAEALAARENG